MSIVQELGQITYTRRRSNMISETMRPFGNPQGVLMGSGKIASAGPPKGIEPPRSYFVLR